MPLNQTTVEVIRALQSFAGHNPVTYTATLLVVGIPPVLKYLPKVIESYKKRQD